MKRKPNIILINCDDLGYGDIGCYGSTLNKTPVLDGMAKDGLKLTSFYTGSPVCSPSRGGMMTGCYPPRISFGEFDGHWVLFPGMGIGLSPEEDTIPSVLKHNGYATKLVGKWHCGDQPEHLPLAYGFDEYLGLPYSNDMGRQVNRTKYPPLPLIENNTVVEEQPDQCDITDLYTRTGVEFIERNVDRPFFLYLAHMHVHRPLYAAKRFVEQSNNGDFGACVEAIDHSTGVILDTLKRLNLEENTLVIFTSDNGGLAKSGGSNAPLKGIKGTTWEGGQRVCCLMQWKGTISANSVSDELMSNIDFLPTFMNIAGAKKPLKNKIDGVDCFRMILSGEKSSRDTFFYYMQNGLEAVRDHEWKLHVAKKEVGNAVVKMKALYNLKDDIGETNNLYDQHPEIVERMMLLMDDCRKELGDSITETVGSEVRPTARKENPSPLTEYDESHPYIIAMYDRDDAG